MQLSQEASDKTLFVASARMYTKALGWVRWELGPALGLRQVAAAPSPGKGLFGHKVPLQRCP